VLSSLLVVVKMNELFGCVWGSWEVGGMLNRSWKLEGMDLELL
jgi:hypothetical protein